MVDFIKLKDIVDFEPKSKIKAGEGKLVGNYNFYTSSPIQNKYLDSYQHNEEALVFGTGGSPSIHYVSDYFSVSTDCFVVKNKNSNILLKYVYYFLKGNNHILEEGFQGAGLKHISKKYIENILIPVISLKAQNEIIENTDTIIKIIQKRQIQIKALDELTVSLFIEMFGDPVINPKKFSEEKLKDIGIINRGKSKHRPRNAPELLNGPYPLIQTGDVANSGLYINEYKSTYSEIGLQQSKLWPNGTLCITIAANIAKTGILKFDACFPDSMVGFFPTSKVTNVYMHYWFSFFQKILESAAPESAQKNINLKILNNLKVIVPPKELIEEFDKKISAINNYQNLLEVGLKEMNLLYNSFLQNVFQGELSQKIK